MVAKTPRFGRQRPDGAPEWPLVRARRAATVGFGVLLAITFVVMLGTNSPNAFYFFVPALLPAAVGSVVIIAATRARERRVLRGEILDAQWWWARPRGIVVAITGALLIVVGAFALEAGLILELSSLVFWGEPQTSRQAWAGEWGGFIAVMGVIGLLVGTVLYPVATIKTATSRAVRLQVR